MANVVEISQRGQAVVGFNPVTGKLTMLKTNDEGALQIELSGASINVDLTGASPTTGDSVYLYAYDGAANQRVACTAGGVLKIEEVVDLPLTPDVDGVTAYGTSTGTDNIKLKLDADGHQQIDILTDQPINPTDDGIKVFGTTGAANVQVSVDAAGHTQADVLTMPGDRMVHFVSLGNILAGEHVTSIVQNVLPYGTVSILINAASASAINGLEVRMGNSETTLYAVAVYDIPAGDTKQVVLDMVGQYLQIDYAQGVAAGIVDVGVYVSR